ncbi:MAG: fasciclin domain-containing protein [Akkermansiaceae bacterium]
MKTIATSILLGLAVLTTPVIADHHKNAKKDIVDTAVAAGSFNTLAAALKAAGLVETMKGEGPFTVFAPTDEAFAKLPKETLEMLLKPENKDKLVNILTYHVVAGKVMSPAAVKLDKATALNKKAITLAVKGEALTLNGSAKVVKADIKCSNGVIHVIDAVIMPPSK